MSRYPRHTPAPRRLLLSFASCAALVGALMLAAAGAPARAASSSTGPVLVVVSHPDDETLGFAGVIESAVAAGRSVYVAVVTNGAGDPGGVTDTGWCGTSGGTVAAEYAERAIQRDRESESAMGILGGSAILRTNDVATSHLFFLGYPNGSLPTIVSGGSFADPSGLNHTYADQGDSSGLTCNGDYHYLRTGSHASLTSSNLQGDVAALLAQIAPTDVYTHGIDEGHSDHATVARLVLDAIHANPSLSAYVHSTLIHETGDGFCQAASADWWPNPENTTDPVARSTPGAPFAAPPLFAATGPYPNSGTGYSSCPDGSPPVGHDWGPLGPPTDEVTVPADMQLTDLSANKKWQAISAYGSQLGCPSQASCGYLHAFVKSDEVLWTQQVSATGRPVPIDWPRLSGATVSGKLVSLSVSWPDSPTWPGSGAWPGAAFIGGSTYAYQWWRCDAASLWQCTAADGATGTTYTIGSGDVGYALRVSVTAGNAAGDAAPVFSGPAIIPGPPTNTVAPAISGTPKEGTSLTASPGTWTGSPTFYYEWQYSTAPGGPWADINGGPAYTSYYMDPGDVGHYLRVVVTATNASGSATAESAGVGPVAVLPANTAPPTVSGTAQASQTLTADPGTWTGTPAPSFTYQWQSSADGSTGWQPIVGATGQSYAVQAGDVGAYLRVAVTGTNGAGSATAASAATAAVQAAPSGGGGSGGGGSGGGSGDGSGGSSGGTGSGGSSGGSSSGGSSSGGSSGGGGGAFPDVAAAVAVDSADVPPVGSEVVWHVTVSNRPGTQSAFNVFADIVLPVGFTVTNTYSDRGKGCVAAPPGLVCDLDYVAFEAAGHITIWGTVGQPGPQTLSVHVRHFLQEGNPDDDSATLTLAPMASSPRAEAPRIRLVGAAPTGGRVAVRVGITGWTVNATPTPGADGSSGYWVIYVDGKRNAVSRLAGKGVTTRLAPGRHTLLVELVGEDGQPLDPRAQSTRLVVVVPAPRIRLVGAAPAGGRVAVRVAITGWTVNATPTPGADGSSGYWVIYVDGKRNAGSRLQDRGVTTRLAPGRHTLRVELVGENGKPVASSVRVVVTVPRRASQGG